MRHILLFSGGYDSTLLLADMISKCNDEDEIVAITIRNNLTGESKNRREESAQHLILHELRKRYPKIRIVHEIIKVESEWQLYVRDTNRGLAQPLMWLCSVIPMIENRDIVYLGYLKDDDAGAYMSHIKGLWENAMQIQDGKSIKLEMPFKCYTKMDVLKYLIRDYDYLFDLCTSCEGLSYHETDVCGQCVPCTHLKCALIQLCVSDIYSVREKAKEVLDKKFGFKISVEVTTDNDNKCNNDADEDVNYVLDN